jgi:hypothetical protein
LYGDYTTFGAGVYDTKFSGGSWYCNSASTASGVKFVAKGTIFNENIFENLRCYNSKTLQFFHISTVTTPTIWLINNVWRNINFEICPGGGIRFDSFKNCAFQNISFWDAAGAYTNHLIDMGSGTGYESVSNTFINVGRNGDSLAAGIYDIRITSGVSSTLVNCFTQAGDGPSYNFNNKSVTMIGATVGTFVNTAGLFKVGNPFGQIQFANTVNGAFLNYYDEGTWNATLAGTGSDPTVPVVTTGVWTRIGRQVFATAHFVNVDTTGGGGNLVVVGLPFPVTIANGFGPASIQGLGANPIVALPLAGSTQIDLRIATSTATNLTYGAGLNKYLSFTVTYTA